MRLSLRKLVQLCLFVFCLVFLHIYFVAYQEIDRKIEVRRSDVVLDNRDQHGDGEQLVRERINKAPDPPLRFDSQVHWRPKRGVKVYPGEVNSKIPSSPVVKNRKRPRSPPISSTSKTDRETELQDVFISVKTTGKFHRQRLQLLLDTWAPLARHNTYFFTDVEDEEYKKKTNGHLINTNCTAAHSRRALCCKMGVEFDYFIQSNKRWFCHVDDDTYVNVPRLVGLLRTYNHRDDWYLGKPSLSHPIEIGDVDVPGQKVSFWFATGGAGMCISQALAQKMVPFAGGGRLETQGNKIRLPDDCTIGYIIYHYLHQQLKRIEEFHSHLEGLWLLKADDLQNQITFSYSERSGRMNIVQVAGLSTSDDPTRFLSIHCHLHPHLQQCKKRR